MHHSESKAGDGGLGACHFDDRGKVKRVERLMDHHTGEVSEGTAQQWSSEPHNGQTRITSEKES